MKPWKIGTSYAVAISPDGQRLSTVGRDVSMWDLRTRSKIWRASPLADPACTVFSPDGSTLAVKGSSGHIIVADVKSGRRLVDFNNMTDGEGSNLRYSTCGEYIVDATWNGRLMVRTAKSGCTEFAQDFPDEMIQSIHRSADGKMWVIVHACKAISDDAPPAPDYFSLWSWPFRSGEFRVLPERVAFSRTSSLLPDGSLLAVVHGAPPENLSVFQLSDGACVETVAIQSGGTGHAIGWSADGQLIGSVQDNVVVFYAWPSLAKCHEIELACPSDLAYSLRGDVLVLGSWEEGWVMSQKAPDAMNLPR
ncbi:hypothetical protein SAMN04488061_0583 [Filomicrobium insigne]|uniref:WD40 repeat domain-containing protein n=1 Tax=Filomicrobium insigne TaxID=418854 RepID=A0A1H0HQ49_9HYPH|nr:hypothetical protein SAMN04488061_0583 [Filomicrobium insigne]